MKKLTSDISEEDRRFFDAKSAVLCEKHIKAGIGTYKEKVLHKTIKLFLEPDAKYHEIKHLGYVADIKKDNQIFEVQTRSFSCLKNKLNEFLKESNVTVVYPLPYEKYITWIDNSSGEMSKRRKSPKHACIFDGTYEIYNIRQFVRNKKFSIKLIFVNVDDFKSKGGKVIGKKRKSVRIDRIPISIERVVDLKYPNDYKVFLPENLPETFTADSFSKAVSPKFKYGYSVIQILIEAGIVAEGEKIGRKTVYKLKNADTVL